MSLPNIKYCPGTLAQGYDTYSRTCLNRVFDGRKVSHVLPYDWLATDTAMFEESIQRISISGVQEKFSLILEKNKLRLVNNGERGTHILKPAPSAGKKPGQMPANEHVTMQIARQLYGIETAENALIFFNDGTPAYIIKRFDVNKDGGKLAQDDFASLAERTPQTHGEHFKYLGSYLEMFRLMQKYVPAYTLEAPKLLKLLIFNFLFSNGDAHFKNFSLLETPLGDYRLSPAYDLLSSRLHINDKEFAVDEGLLPKSLAQGKTAHQFAVLAEQAGINKKVFDTVMAQMLQASEKVQRLTFSSFLDETSQRHYWQCYQGRLKQLMKE